MSWLWRRLISFLCIDHLWEKQTGICSHGWLNQQKMTWTSSPRGICCWIVCLKSKSGGEKWNITLISHPNSSLHHRDPQVCPFNKQCCPWCLSNLSQFVWKLSKDQRIRLFLWPVFTETRHNICPSERCSCHWNCPEIYSCPFLLAVAACFVSVVGDQCSCSPLEGSWEQCG